MHGGNPLGNDSWIFLHKCMDKPACTESKRHKKKHQHNTDSVAEITILCPFLYLLECVHFLS